MDLHADQIVEPVRPLRLAHQLIIGLAAALIAPFTGFAWPLALLTGFVIGESEAERARGIRRSAGVRLVRILAVTGGVLGAMILGAVVGGIIAFLIMALAAFSERIAAGTSRDDHLISRLLVIVVTTAGWLILFTALGIHLEARFGL